VHEDAAGNGWQVRVRFGRDSKSFGRAAHAWSLDAAKEIADRLQREHGDLDEDLSVAEIRIEGKDGNGDIKPGQTPRLPDWPIVEHDFRTRSRKRSAEVDKKLAEVKAAYEDAAQKTEEVLAEKPADPAKVEKSLKDKAVEDAYRKYNQKVDELEKELFKGKPQPLPRFKMPEPKYIYEHSRDWPEAKRMQFQAEGISRDVRRRQSDLETFREEIAAEQKKIIFDDEAGRKSGDLAQREEKLKESIVDYNEKLKPLREQQSVREQLDQAVNRQVNALDSLLLDKSRIAPPPDGFATGADAVYKSAPQTQIVKTDPAGKPLPDDQQPPGYPKEFLGGALKNDERLVVDPNLRVDLLSKEPDKGPGEVKAGVFGKVTEVDPQAGKVAVQVDPRGSQIIVYGVNPQNVRVGDYIEPRQSIGRWRPSPRNPSVGQLVFQALNANKRPVPPGPLLDFAKKKPAIPGQLKKDIPEPDPTPLPAKEGTLPPPDGNGKDDRKWIVFDDTIPKKFASKNGAIDARIVLAERELQLAKGEENRKTNEAGEAANKAKQLERELMMAKEKLQSIEKEGDGILAKVEELEVRKKDLAKTLEKLKKQKQVLEGMAVRLKGSKNDKEIDAFNAQARKHNLDEQKLRQDVKMLTMDETKLQSKIAELQREQKKAKDKHAELEKDRNGLEMMAKTAQSALEQAKTATKAKEDAVKALQEEKKRLADEEAAERKEAEEKRKKDAETKKKEEKP
jgi:hypothetical protein